MGATYLLHPKQVFAGMVDFSIPGLLTSSAQVHYYFHFTFIASAVRLLMQSGLLPDSVEILQTDAALQALRLVHLSIHDVVSLQYSQACCASLSMQNRRLILIHVYLQSAFLPVSVE